MPVTYTCTAIAWWLSWVATLLVPIWIPGPLSQGQGACWSQGVISHSNFPQAKYISIVLSYSKEVSLNSGPVCKQFGSFVSSFTFLGWGDLVAHWPPSQCSVFEGIDFPFYFFLATFPQVRNLYFSIFICSKLLL